MKRIILLVFTAVSLGLSGCMGTLSPRRTVQALPSAAQVVGDVGPRALVNAILDAVLPPSFTGPINATFARPVFVTIEAIGVNRSSSGDWGFTYLKITVNDSAIGNTIELGEKPKPP